MRKSHENNGELILRLARTDFKLRYHGSVLGYVWAIIKPLLLFTILTFVFYYVFNIRGLDVPYYPLQLLTGLLLFNFFSEGTVAGMSSLLAKAQLVTKTYVPRWTLVVASTMNALFVFCMNLIVLAGFFAFYGKLPSFAGITVFVLMVACLYALIVAFSLFASGLYVRFRDLAMIWEVLLSVLMYASPILYPLSLVPASFQPVYLLNPIAFIIHHAKSALIINAFPSGASILALVAAVGVAIGVAYLVFIKMEKRIAEYL